MTPSEPGRETAVQSDARGRHWVAWIPDENGKPRDSVVLVAESREEAERLAREWARMNGR